MNLLGYVSDEMYVAIAGVSSEWQLDDGQVFLFESTARGAFYGDVPQGEYHVTLAKTGFGSKTVRVTLSHSTPIQFRLHSDSLIGYAWPKWVQAGEEAEFRVHSVEQYQLTLWRYGAIKERVRMLGWIDEHGPFANRQILPDGDFTQIGVKWNQQGYLAAPRVTAPDRTGLYYFWARTPSGRAFSFPWIVAPARPTAKIAVLASTNTWNAYNNYGGRSNYVNANRLPDTPVVDSRHDLQRYQDPTPFNVWKHADEDYLPLSFDRPEPHNHMFDDPDPTEPIRGRVQCGQAPAEWRLYAWLEREGYEYDLYSDAQLHEGRLPLDSYRLLIIALHPEYWTREMYVKVKEWVFERGGRLMYLGGNGLNCEVTLNREGQMRCLTHLHSLSGELGGHSLDGATEYESRMHRTFESEANLLGVVCSATGIMTAAPFRVIEPDHWVFERTDLHTGDTFGEETLHERIAGGASGHETDKRSNSSPRDTLLLAKGLNMDDGGAEITLHETHTGGAVFSVGSITWVSALFTDPHVARITANVIDRFTA